MKAKLAIATTTILVAFAAGAYEYTWTGFAGTADWATSGNWSSSDGGTSYPSAEDTAIVPAGGAIVELGDSGATIAKLTLNGDLTLTCSKIADDGSGDLHMGEVDGAGQIILNNGAIANIRGSTLVLTNNVVVSDETETKNNRMCGYESPIEFRGSLSGSGTVTFHGWWSNGGVKLYGDNSGFTGVGIVDSDGNNNTCFYAPSAMSAGADWIFQGTPKKNRILFDDQGSDEANTVRLGSLTAADLRSDGAYVRVNIDKDGRTTGIARFKTILEIGGNNHDSQFLQTMGDATYGVQTPVCLRKVGDGTLTIYEPRHSYGTEINGGTLEVTSTNSIRSLTDNVITFGGGTLKYGIMTKSSNNTDLETPVPVTTDWSSRIGFAANTADISVETTGADVTWATSIPATHVHGLVKNGTGTLDVQGYSAYVGKTIVSNGTLKVGFLYSGHLTNLLASASMTETNRTFAVENDATLEVTLRNNVNNGSYRHEMGVLGLFPDGTKLTISSQYQNGFARWGDVSTTGFKGTVDFPDVHNMSSNTGGLLASLNEVGSADVDWGITGAPANETRIFAVEANAGAVAKFGALRVPSQNAKIYMKQRGTFEIGALNKESVINGKIEVNNAEFTLKNVGGKLLLGTDFAIVGANKTTNIVVEAGTFVNNADLSAYTVNIGSGVILGGTSVFGDVNLSVNDVIPPALTAETDKATEFTLLTATSFTGTSAAMTALFNEVNASVKGGKWKLRRDDNGDGTVTLKCAFAKSAFIIVVR